MTTRDELRALHMHACPYCNSRDLAPHPCLGSPSRPNGLIFADTAALLLAAQEKAYEARSSREAAAPGATQ